MKPFFVDVKCFFFGHPMPLNGFESSTLGYPGTSGDGVKKKRKFLLKLCILASENSRKDEPAATFGAGRIRKGAAGGPTCK